MKSFFHSYFFFLSFYPSIHPTCPFSSLSFLPRWSFLSLLPFLLNFLFSILLSLYHIDLFLSPLNSIHHVFPPFLLPVLQIPLTSFLTVLFPFVPFSYHPVLFSFLLPLFLYGIKFFLSWFSPILFLSFVIFAFPFFFLVSYNYSCQFSFFLLLHSKCLGLVRSLYCF